LLVAIALDFKMILNGLVRLKCKLEVLRLTLRLTWGLREAQCHIMPVEKSKNFKPFSVLPALPS